MKMNSDEGSVEEEWNQLLDWYDEPAIERVAVAFSGGKDSTLVLDSATEALEDVIALIIDAEVYPDREIQRAEEKADEFGVDHMVLESSKLKHDEFKTNPPDRCYHCKLDLFQSIKDELDEGRVILEGTNASEVEGHRPGLEAVQKHAKAPLLESGLKEEDVREILRWRGREVWDRPSYACLASRFPPGTELSEEKLKRVERVEDRIFDMGFTQLRVRDFGETARIEIYQEEMDDVLERREDIVEILKDEGYENVLLDLEGYITGSISPDG